MRCPFVCSFARLLVFLSFSLLWAQGDFQKGISYYKQGQYARAIDEFEQIVAATPNYEDGHRILGDCYLKTKNYPKAIESFQKALRLKGDIYASYLGLALAYYNSGKYQEVLDTLNRGERLARAPRDKYQLYRSRGSAYFNLRDFQRALMDLLRAESIQRGEANDILQIGISYYHLKKYKEADNYLNRALTLDPNSEAKRYLSRLNYRQAIEAMELKNYKGAAAILSDYLAQHPQDGEAWFNLGLAHLFADDLKASESAFLNAARFMPGHAETHSRLGFIYEKSKNYNRALQHYQKAHQLTPDTQTRESVERVQERLRRQNS